MCDTYHSHRFVCHLHGSHPRANSDQDRSIHRHFRWRWRFRFAFASRRFASLRGASRRFAALCRSVTQQLPTCVACWRCTGESQETRGYTNGLERARTRRGRNPCNEDLCLYLQTHARCTIVPRAHWPFSINVTSNPRRSFRAQNRRWLKAAICCQRPSRLYDPAPVGPVRLYSSQRASTFHYKIAGDFVCASTYIEVMCISEHTLQNARTLASHRNINLR